MAPTPPPITWRGMARAGRLSPGRPLGPPRLLVLHATAGRGPGDLSWLRSGGGEPPAVVSCHYYIDKAGQISQLVDDGDTAWHCGSSSWEINGRRVSGSHAGVARLNWLSVGVELENRNDGRDPYPAAQVDAAVALFRWLRHRHDIPLSQVVRHLDIAPGRKTDPAGFPWAGFLAALQETPDPAGTPILGGPSVPASDLVALLDRRVPHLSWQQRSSLVTAYCALGEWTTIGNLRPLAQAIKEASHPSGRPWFGSDRFLTQYNPAGLGATNDGAAGARFDTIAAGVAAQYAHLLCYAAQPEQLPPDLAALSLASPRREALIGAFGLGAAPTWEQLSGRWAWPGPTYGEDILTIAAAIAGGRA